ncbi:MAG: NUDIX domain-containing protein [Planctomycetota bacterium]
MGIERRGMSVIQIAVGLIWFGDSLVVGRREGDVPLAGFDEFPGGKCHPSESPLDAVHRECREETGLDIEVLGLRLEQEHEYAHGRLQISFFDCRPAEAVGGTGSPPSLLPPFGWVRLDDVFRLRFPDANQALLETIKRSRGPQRNDGVEDSTVA